MDYNGTEVLSAWKKFVNEGILDATHLRPEIARSWLRCREHCLDPWAANFDTMDEEELRRRGARYHKVREAAGPVLQYLVTLFNCNASVADMDGFVFELLTPLSVYSRTLGTYVIEKYTGSGNLPLALIEKKPIRVDGFEHYRAVSQNYSGVSSPMEIKDPAMGAVINMNDPFTALPKEALDICVAAGHLIETLCSSRQEIFMHLSTAAFFDPILKLGDRAVIVVDQDGMILTANEPGKELVSEFENYPYAGQSLGEYLKNRQELFMLLKENTLAVEARIISFKSTKQRKAAALQLLRSRTIQLLNGMIHNILIFDKPEYKAKMDDPGVLRRKEAPAVDYIGVSDAWQEVDVMVRRIAMHKSNVLLLGSTGTGKEVVARAIHRLSGRRGEFVAINCGAIPRDLLASELFGYEGGAFTGARASGAAGKFEYANGGTLFLDEIGEMPLDMQVTLLRVLQEQTVTRIGSNKPVRFDVRIIAATNQNIEELIQEKKFRSDLRYRLSVIEIQLPLLRDRREDIPLLAQHFSETMGESLCIQTFPLSQEVEHFLMRYSWPGNVRELKNAMEKALILAGGRPITADDFPSYMKENHTGRCFRTPAEDTGKVPAGKEFQEAEDVGYEVLSPKQHRELRGKKQIVSILEKNCGNISKTAKELGISRNTLYRRIHKLGIKIRVFAQSDE